MKNSKKAKVLGLVLCTAVAVTPTAYYVSAQNEVTAQVAQNDTLEAGAIILTVASIEKFDGYIRVDDADGVYSAFISADTQVVPELTKRIVKMDDIEVGTQLAIYSETATMSIPAQLNAYKAVILEREHEDTAKGMEGINKPVISVPDGKKDIKITVNGVEGNVTAVYTDGVCMLPVRYVCEGLGLDVDWSDSLQAVTVGTVQMGANFAIGENSYKKAKMTAFTLTKAPELIDDKTYVPLDFFTEILEAQVNTDNDAVTINLAD